MEERFVFGMLGLRVDINSLSSLKFAFVAWHDLIFAHFATFLGSCSTFWTFTSTQTSLHMPVASLIGQDEIVRVLIFTISIYCLPILESFLESLGRLLFRLIQLELLSRRWDNFSLRFLRTLTSPFWIWSLFLQKVHIACFREETARQARITGLIILEVLVH